jgi:hypothetical protein
MDFYVSYHHTKFELQTQLICGETKKKENLLFTPTQIV